MVRQRTIAVIVFDGVNALDVSGPLEAFSNVRLASGKPAYRPIIWSAANLHVTSESGLTFLAEDVLPNNPSADYLLLPGGGGVRDPVVLKNTARWLADNQAGFSNIVSICTGAYILAESGLLEDQKITTHWAYIADISRRYPRITFDADVLFTRNGRFYSSGGVTSGIDLALELIEQDFGPAKALEVARELVVFLRRTGSQSQFSEPLKVQISGTGRFEDACRWAMNNLESNLSVDALAEKANLSSRQFSRRFAAQFGMSPASYLQNLRLDLARSMLEEGGIRIEQILPCTGFKSTDVFRRVFKKRFHVTPSEYRHRFSKNGQRL